MEPNDKDIIIELVSRYPIKEIVAYLSELSLYHASVMSDLMLPEAAKEWSEKGMILHEAAGILKK